jgi:hypothetical protein
MKPYGIASGSQILCHKRNIMNPEFLNTYFKIPQAPVIIPSAFVNRGGDARNALNSPRSLCENSGSWMKF